MNYQLVLACALLAGCVAGISCEASNEEKQLLTDVFSEERSITPEECLKCLQELKRIYADDDKQIGADRLSDNQKSIRIVVDILLQKAEISESNCSQEKLDEFEHLKKYLRGYSPNAQSYLQSYKERLAKLCKL